MSLYNFKLFALNRMDETEIQADSIKLICEDGQEFELAPRKSDGEVTLYSKGRLGIRPQASNCIRITDDS